MLFSLPESYAAYATQKDVRAAVDHILNSKSLKVPSDLDWDQLPDFHAAVLAAHQVRCEYASTLQRLWNDVWQKALDSSGLELEASSIAETQELQDLLDTKSIWEGGWFCRVFRKDAFYVYPTVELDQREASLWLWCGDYSGENNQTPTLLSSESDWDTESIEGEDWGRTRKRIAPMGSGGVELDRLYAAAERALEKVVSFVAT